MDYRVRILLLPAVFFFSVQGIAFHSVEEIPPPLLKRTGTVSKPITTLKRSPISIEKSKTLPVNGTTLSNASGAVLVVQRSHSSQPASAEHGSLPMNNSVTTASENRAQNVTAPSMAAPEFEDRNEQDEGGKGEETLVKFAAGRELLWPKKSYDWGDSTALCKVDVENGTSSSIVNQRITSLVSLPVNKKNLSPSRRSSAPIFENPDAHVDETANAVPPADDETAGEGVAKEDTEPVKGKDKEENQLGAMVEDAKGNIPVPPAPNKFQTHVDFDQSEDSHFMTFIMVGGLLVFCLYLLHHNKKKILGLVFEGRAPAHHRRNVRYRRLSQRDEHDKEDVIY